MNNNLANALTKYIKESGKAVTSKEVYGYFLNKGYSNGQISGAIRQLKIKGHIVSPKRGFYENMNSKNVLNEMEQDIKELINKYDKSVSISIFNALKPDQKQKYADNIASLKNMIKSDN